jgi:hypothetical protein
MITATAQLPELIYLSLLIKPHYLFRRKQTASKLEFDQGQGSRGYELGGIKSLVLRLPTMLANWGQYYRFFDKSNEGRPESIAPEQLLFTSVIMNDLNIAPEQAVDRVGTEAKQL